MKRKNILFLVGFLAVFVFIFGVSAIGETCVQNSNYQECTDIWGKKSLEVHSTKYQTNNESWQPYQENLIVKRKGSKINITLNDKFGIILKTVPMLNDVEYTWQQVFSAYPQMKYNTTLYAYKDGKLKFDLNMTNGGDIGENLPDGATLRLDLIDSHGITYNDVQKLDDGLLFFNQYKLWIPEGCANINKTSIVLHTLNKRCLDPALEVGNNVTLGGEHEYTWIIVHQNSTIFINSSQGWLNITATENISIYGTIDGVGASGNAGGGGGGCSDATAGSGLGGGSGGARSGCGVSENGGGGGGAGSVNVGGAGGSGGTASGGSGGTVYGNTTSRILNITSGKGSGGGGGGNPNIGAGSALGGAGGAAIKIKSPLIIINGSVQMAGGSGLAASGNFQDVGGGGGGSGGTIILDGRNITLVNGTLGASGGGGATCFQTGGSNCGGGGGGSGGKIKIIYSASMENSSSAISVTGAGGGGASGSGSSGATGSGGSIHWEKILGIETTLSSPANGTSSPAGQTFYCNSTLDSSTDFLINITFYLWNSTGVLNTTITNGVNGTTNSTSFDHTFTKDDIYEWNCFSKSNSTIGAFASNNFTITASIDKPSINLDTPSDNQFFTSENNINFSYTPIDANGIDTCQLYGNWTGTFESNQTDSSITNESSNSFPLLNLTEGNYIWNVMCNDTVNNINFAPTNFTFGIDLTNPSLIIDSPTGTVSTSTPTININATDNNLESCFYNVTTSGGAVEVTHRRIDNCANATMPSISDGDYIGFYFINDSSGRQNITNQSFTVSTAAPPTGGGGGTTIIITGEAGWIMQVAEGIARFDIEMPTSSSRNLVIEFENIGESERDITLSCEDVNGNVCQYIEFPESPFILPALKDQKLQIISTITLPGDAPRGDFQFNIKAIDDVSQEGTVTVFLGIGTAGIITETIGKLFIRTEGGFPYIILFFIFFLPIVIGMTAFIPKGTTAKTPITFIVSLLIPFLIVFFF